MFAILMTAVFAALLVAIVILAGCPDPVCRKDRRRCTIDEEGQRCIGGQWRTVLDCKELWPRERYQCGSMRGEVYCEQVGNVHTTNGAE